ncbi:MAG: TRAP transporter permease [Desulfobacteraceae bacterium]|nr:MAG: TRAP transporter permease [Desulfobacteraceae bacterium]
MRDSEPVNMGGENRADADRLRSGITRGVAVTMALYHILFITHLFESFGVYLLAPTFLAGSLFFILIMTFLVVPARKGLHNRFFPWYDMVFVVLSAVATIYAFVMGQDMAMKAAMPKLSPIDLAMGSILIVMVLEAVRRTLGLVLALIPVAFILETMFSNYIPGMFQGRGFTWEFIVKQMYLWDTGIFNVPLRVAATMIFAFLVFGAFLELCGVGNFFIDFALSLVGRYRGGPAKVSVISSALFGMISGSSTANVSVDGVITIPLMKKAGFKPHYAAAVEAVTSNGGQLMPPVMGAVAFVIPEFLGISYASVCKAAAIPAILYFFALFVMIDLEARKIGLKAVPSQDLPLLGAVLREGWFNFIPIAVLILLLGVFSYQAEFSALGSVVVLLTLTLVRRKVRINWRTLLEGLEKSSRGMLEVGAACAAAGIVIGCVGLSGLGQKLSMGLIEISGGSLFLLLLLTAGACFVLGMGMTSLPIYIMLVVLVSPALVKMNVLPIAAHLFIFYWGLTSFITPPVCISVFVAAAIAESSPFRTGWQAARLGIVTYIIPFLFVYGPGLLLEGTMRDVILAVATSLLGVTALAISISGYFRSPLDLFQRALMFLGAIGLMHQGFITDLIGLNLVALPIFAQLRKRNSSVVEEKG